MKGTNRRAIVFPQDPTNDTVNGREWLVANARGGYASSTLVNIPTRRFHGLLIASLPTPLGRSAMLSNLSERLILLDGSTFDVGGFEWAAGGKTPSSMKFQTEFVLDSGMPTWRYQMGSVALTKQIVLVHARNTVHVIYRIEGGAARLELFPALNFRPHEGIVVPTPAVRAEYIFSSVGTRYEVHGPAPYPPLRMGISAPRSHSFTVDASDLTGILLRTERDRGYDHVTWAHCPGFFQADLLDGESASLVASTEAWESIDALSADEARDAERLRRARLLVSAAAGDPHPDETSRELILAADQFIISPSSRAEDAERALATGDEVRSVIAGYHWFTDWGRDTMISLPGLTLATGRHREAGYILRTFGKYVKDGLIPNLFPEGKSEGLYHTADATLWFFNAIDRYLRASNDRMTLRLLLPVLREILKKHIEGTRFGIGVDPKDGLLHQGAEGYQLTWMDAKVGDWVVTPRRGKAVEINALFYNALRLAAGWISDEDGEAEARPIVNAAARVKESFNARFWYEAGGHLYDVIDGPDGTNDPALRPNQLFAVSLTHPVLDPSRWRAVVEVCQRDLLTPVGLRSLSPHHPDYKPKYDGDLRTRDAAYHQGTVWSWLIGTFVDAWLRVNPSREGEAAVFLEGFHDHISEGCVGSISEIFDAEAPFSPRGCVSQAWGVAEVLRASFRISGRVV